MRKIKSIAVQILGLMTAAAMVCCCAACGSAGLPNASTPKVSSSEAVSSQGETAITPREYFQNAPSPKEEPSFGMIRDICETVTSGERFFSTKRQELEEAEVIPALHGGYQFTCGAFFEEDNRLKELSLSWKLVHTTDWGYGENFLIVSVSEKLNRFPGVDEYASHFGQYLARQEGTEIVAVGSAETEKCLTFQKEKLWYRIYGSEGIPAEDILAVLEHFLRRPIEVEAFAKEKGDEYTWATLAEVPDAFAGYYPVDSELCPSLIPTASEVRLQNGVPVAVLLAYDTAASGHAVIGWDIYRENPDFGLDLWEEYNFAGDISNLTEQDLREYWKRGIVQFQHRFPFSWDSYQIAARLSTDATPEQLWQLLQELQERQ